MDPSYNFVVGYFMGIPVYQPLYSACVDMFRFDKRRENAEPRQLVLGGGSGEHPAIIFNDLEYCVAVLLTSKWSPVDSDPTNDIYECTRRYSTSDYIPVEFCNWRSDYHLEFRKRCESAYSFFANENSYKYEDDEVFIDVDGTELRNPPGTSFERWLCFNIGEFVYAALPDITPTIQRWREKLGPIKYPWFRNVLVLPPGYRDERGDLPEAIDADLEKAKTRGGTARFKVVDRFPGYHEFRYNESLINKRQSK